MTQRNTGAAPIRRQARTIAVLAAVLVVAGAAAACTASPGPVAAVGVPAKAGAEAGAPAVGTWPSEPPARICGDNAILGKGPTSPPDGVVVVPAGDNSSLALDFMKPGVAWWFAPGVHTLGTDIYSQIIPGNGSSFVGAPGAVIDGQNKNLFAFTQSAKNVTIRYLEIRNFGTGKSNNDQGVVNHDAGTGWTVENTFIHDNDGAGLVIGSQNKITYNCLKDNGQYGFSAVNDENGVDTVLFDHNEVVGNNTDDWERLRAGCGCTGGGKFWATKNATVTDNWVHDNKGAGIWSDFNNSGFLIEGNYIENNDNEGIYYEISYNFMIRNNVIKRNALVEGKGFADKNNPFPAGAIYISESGGDPQAGPSYNESEITGNLLEDNWDGVVLWENADRFCRPNETLDTSNTCPPFDRTWGKRYRTQNVKIHDNEFKVNKAAIGCTNAFCGRMALFSNYGSSPSNSPYLGYIVPWNLTFEQNVVFQSNKYLGVWSFAGFQSTKPDGTLVSWTDWTKPSPPIPADPNKAERPTTFGQDAGSTIQQ